MRPLQAAHAVATVLLLVAALGLGVLMLAGVIDVRLPTKARTGDLRAVERDGRPGAEQVGVRARLLVVRGAKPGMEYPVFEGQNFIGRADEKPVDIDLDIQESRDRIWSSRQHAVITCEGDALVTEDLNSSNGTYVNRSLVPPANKQAIKANDILQIGDTQLQSQR